MGVIKNGARIWGRECIRRCGGWVNYNANSNNSQLFEHAAPENVGKGRL